MAKELTRRERGLSRRRGWPMRMFEDMFGSPEEFWGLRPWNEGFVPAVDVSEDDEKIEIHAEVPGMTRDDIDVSVENGVLTVSGEKKEEERKEETNYHRVERSYGHFERRMRLPEGVDEENIDASYTDGVLSVTVPKTEKPAPRRIEVT
jgi:HSP20 family protein